jgi:hypothetical protein
MTLQETLNFVFSNQIPADVAAFFARRSAIDREMILRQLEGGAREASRPGFFQPQRETLNTHLVARKRELQELATFAAGAIYSVSAEIAAVKLMARDVVQRQIAETEGALADLQDEEAERNRLSRAWDNLVRLARCVVLDTVPDRGLAEAFDLTPEQLASRQAWARYLEEEARKAAMREEARREVEEIALKSHTAAALPAEPQTAIESPEAIDDAELEDLVTLALPGLDHLALRSIVEAFQRRQVGGQIAEQIFNSSLRFREPEAGRKAACERLLRFAAHINPPLRVYAGI